MTVPSYYNTAFDKATGSLCTDVADVLAALYTSFTNTLPSGSRWTELAANYYRSPIQDPSGTSRYMTLQLARTTQFNMAFHLRDKNGSSVRNGSISFTTSMTWRTWTGPYHCCVEFEYGGGPTYEDALALMVDPTPFGYGSLWPYVGGWTNRDSGGSPSGTNYHDMLTMLDSGTVADRISFQGQGLNTNYLTTGGNYVTMPAEVTISGAAGWLGGGKLYQMIACSDVLAPKTVFTVPLDTGTTGQFQVLGRVANPSPQAQGKLAVRYG